MLPHGAAARLGAILWASLALAALCGCAAQKRGAAVAPAPAPEMAGMPSVRGMDGYAFYFDPARWEMMEDISNPAYEYQFANRSGRMLGAVWVDQTPIDPARMEAAAVRNAERLTFDVRVSQSGAVELGGLPCRYLRLFGRKDGAEMVIEYTLCFVGSRSYVVMTTAVGPLNREMIEDMNAFPRGMRPGG
ncbi:hypothetical protein [Fundidesulfovibrio agrisoli]|uniref:hypothetical protein n=1 Tax=Fundidesulfovibrio agrisoli TaxID=2922717 RepID=UPI001FAD8D8A|nr:hypothetical protein [Fundidesulfovibrio agrisoli]